MDQKFKISIVIPNWNGRVLLEKHLKSVIDCAGDAEIIITDDCSIDGSIEYIKKNYPNIHIVINQKQSGFAGNVNNGVKHAHGYIIVLLNTDVSPEKDFLEPLISHFNNEKVFAVGCLERSHEGNQIVLRGRGLSKWIKGYYIHSRGEVDQSDTAWVSGGSGAFRKSIWNKLGGMDEIYNPFYWEDIDLSYRAVSSGYQIIFEPKSIVDHFHETGKIKNTSSDNKVKVISYRNQFLFIWKNAPTIITRLEQCFWIPVRLLQAILSGDVQMWMGFAAALVKTPQLFFQNQNNK
jgi:GT2 family glycosyltransferase